MDENAYRDLQQSLTIILESNVAACDGNEGYLSYQFPRSPSGLLDPNSIRVPPPSVRKT